jgi:hypothetical protein
MYFDNDDDMSTRGAMNLADEASRFRSRVGTGRRSPIKIIVSDFEFIYDMKSFRRYQYAEGDPTENWCRWPYHHVCAAAWLPVTFRPGLDQPEIGQIVTMTADPFCEQAIVSAYLSAVQANPDAHLYSWGAEQKDWPVVRRVAMETGMQLPRQLTDMRPHAPSRVDLCNSTSGQARCTHLPEYAYATGLPTKPLASKAVGNAVLQGRWDEVEEQVCADLLTTSIIAARHAVAFGLCQADIRKTEQAIANAFTQARPQSRFFASAPRRIAGERALPISARIAS